MAPQEMRKAITSVWLIVSAIFMSILIAPHLLSESTLLAASTAFQSHHAQEPCSFCGMTRAFTAIAHGNPAEAVAFNSWSIVLYGFLVTNSALAAIFVSNLIRKLFLSHRAARHVDKSTTGRHIHAGI